MKNDSNRLSATDVLLRYHSEILPDFCDLHDVNQIGIWGDRPLQVACIRGNIEEVIALLEGGADVHAKGDIGQTPLFDAVMGGSYNIVKLILDHGADPLIADETGSTPLRYARTMLNSSKPDSGKIMELLEEAVARAKKQRELN